MSPMSQSADAKLAELGTDAPRLNLGATLRRIRDGRPVAEERDDINALAAIFIEETWRRVETWIDAHAAGLPTSKPVARDDVTYEKATPGSLLTKACSDDIIEDIRARVLSFLDSQVEAWHQFREDRRKHPRPERSAEEARIDRLYETYYHGIVSGKQVSSATDPRYHVKSGLHTAVKTLLNFLKALPHVYREAFHPASVTATQARLIAEQSRRTMITLASMQISYFLAIDEELKRAGTDEDYDPSKFQIVEETDSAGQRTLRMKIRDEVLEAVQRRTSPRAPTTGCPALVVQGASGKSVVAAFYEWILHIADEQYFPYFDRPTTGRAEE